MKKDKLKQIREKYADKVHGAAERIRQAPQATTDTLAAQTRLKYADRWIERTREIGKECNGWDEIDFNDPQISLEWKLCDPANIVMVQSTKTRQKFLDTLTPDELDYFCSDTEA